MTTPSRTCSRCGYTNGVLGDFNFANNRRIRYNKLRKLKRAKKKT